MGQQTGPYYINDQGQRFYDPSGRLYAQEQAYRSSGAPSSVSDARAQYFNTTRGMGDRILNDPILAQAQDLMTQQAQSGGPYSPEVVQAIYNRQADMAAQAEQQGRQLLAENMAVRGGSPYDASMQAENLALLAARQGQNQAARRDIDIQAAMANYQAQQQNAGQLAALRQGQYAAAAPFYGQAAQGYAQVQSNPGDTGQIDRPQEQSIAQRNNAAWQGAFWNKPQPVTSSVPRRVYTDQARSNLDKNKEAEAAKGKSPTFPGNPSAMPYTNAQGWIQTSPGGYEPPDAPGVQGTPGYRAAQQVNRMLPWGMGGKK